MKFESIREQLQPLKTSGYLKFRFNNEEEKTIDHDLLLHHFPVGGGMISGTLGSEAVHIGYPKGVITGPQEKNYKQDFTDPFLEWEFHRNGKVYSAKTGQLNINFETLHNFAKGSFFFETDDDKVSGTFDLKAY